jgi:hypothetical protein
MSPRVFLGFSTWLVYSLKHRVPFLVKCQATNIYPYVGRMPSLQGSAKTVKKPERKGKEKENKEKHFSVY